jgi:hypothetical protein
VALYDAGGIAVALFDAAPPRFAELSDQDTERITAKLMAGAE